MRHHEDRTPTHGYEVAREGRVRKKSWRQEWQRVPQEEKLSEPSTHHHLWAGIDLKIQNASFHFDRMSRTLQPPEATAYTVVLESAGALIGGNWHIAFYAHLDSFLSASRSVPEIIRCLFGADPNRAMKGWFDKLDGDEQKRRRKFEDKFKADYDEFRGLPLGTARNISEHRTGFAPVTVIVSGRFGIYTGGPINPIPMSEMRELPTGADVPPGMARSIPVRPNWQDFKIDGKPLFETCGDYLSRAQALVSQARALADEVHGDTNLTWPSSDM